MLSKNTISWCLGVSKVSTVGNVSTEWCRKVIAKISADTGAKLVVDFAMTCKIMHFF